MAGKITMKQAREYARIQMALLAYNASGTEFDGAGLADVDEKKLRAATTARINTMIKDESELQLATHSEIIKYVKTHF